MFAGGVPPPGWPCGSPTQAGPRRAGAGGRGAPYEGGKCPHPPFSARGGVAGSPSPTLSACCDAGEPLSGRARDAGAGPRIGPGLTDGDGSKAAPFAPR